MSPNSHLSGSGSVGARLVEDPGSCGAVPAFLITATASKGTASRAPAEFPPSAGPNPDDDHSNCAVLEESEK